MGKVKLSGEQIDLAKKMADALFYKVGCDVKKGGHTFIIDGEKPIKSMSNMSHHILPEKAGLAREYMDLFIYATKFERSLFWKTVHKIVSGWVVEGEIPDNNTGFFLLVDINCKDRYDGEYLFNIKHNCLEKELTWEAFLKLYPKEDIEAVQSNPIGCKFIYDPYMELLDKDKNGLRGYWKMNKYTPPKWMGKGYVKPEVSPFIQTLLDHMFIDDSSREYALKWLYLALTSRCSTYLVLNSFPGVGKGVFEAIARSLVGYHNSDEPSSGFLADKFNTIMEDKRLLILDEIKVTEKSKDKLKRYVNNNISIEGKGVNAKRSVPNHCSFIISNNELTDIYLKWNDRRFAVMSLTTEKFNTVMSDKITNRKVKEFEDEDNEEIAAFGHWLLNRYKDKEDEISVYPVPYTSHFHKLVEVSLHEWNKVILEAYLSGKESITLKSLRERSKDLGVRFPSNSFKISDFLNTYRHGPKRLKLGKVEDIYTKRPYIRFIRNEEENLELI